VDPDIDVVDDPSQMARGIDPQLERGIQEVMAAIQRMPKRTAPPAYTKRTAATAGR
jgi:tricorn protease